MTTLEALQKLLPYATHKHNCDAVQPMWHKGPCDCGFRQVVQDLRADNIDIKDDDPPTEEVVRHCENEDCKAQLPSGWHAVYCSDQCALDDA